MTLNSRGSRALGATEPRFDLEVLGSRPKATPGSRQQASHEAILGLVKTQVVSSRVSSFYIMEGMRPEPYTNNPTISAHCHYQGKLDSIAVSGSTTSRGGNYLARPSTAQDARGQTRKTTAFNRPGSAPIHKTAGLISKAACLQPTQPLAHNNNNISSNKTASWSSGTYAKSSSPQLGSNPSVSKKITSSPYIKSVNNLHSVPMLGLIPANRAQQPQPRGSSSPHIFDLNTIDKSNPDQLSTQPGYYSGLRTQSSGSLTADPPRLLRSTSLSQGQAPQISRKLATGGPVLQRSSSLPGGKSSIIPSRRGMTEAKVASLPVEFPCKVDPHEREMINKLVTGLRTKAENKIPGSSLSKRVLDTYGSLSSSSKEANVEPLEVEKNASHKLGSFIQHFDQESSTFRNPLNAIQISPGPPSLDCPSESHSDIPVMDQCRAHPTSSPEIRDPVITNMEPTKVKRTGLQPDPKLSNWAATSMALFPSSPDKSALPIASGRVADNFRHLVVDVPPTRASLEGCIPLLQLPQATVIPPKHWLRNQPQQHIVLPPHLPDSAAQLMDDLIAESTLIMSSLAINDNWIYQLVKQHQYTSVQQDDVVLQDSPFHEGLLMSSTTTGSIAAQSEPYESLLGIFFSSAD